MNSTATACVVNSTQPNGETGKLLRRWKSKYKENRQFIGAANLRPGQQSKIWYWYVFIIHPKTITLDASNHLAHSVCMNKIKQLKNIEMFIITYFRLVHPIHHEPDLPFKI